ncbi:MAG: TetR/AcrR family transcriptional regulator C-terminal domain-containing protein [Actinobacteria bacterium]|nr:TetR/AcrR family transcriptional regulator C-terminal domain-containing protein [Actinomycetota bacterium]
MAPPRKRASSDEGKSRPGLTREAIIAAALEIVDKEGLDALSMRHLGSVLKVDPMAIYYHVPNKSALLDGLMEAVMSEIDLSLDDPSQPGPERIRVAAHMYRNVMMAHPNAVQVVAVRNLNTTESFRPVEFLLGVFVEAGLSPAMAMAAVDIFALFVRGFVLFETGKTLAEEAACKGCEAADLLKQILPMDEFPVMYEVMAKTRFNTADEEFDLGIRALIRGMFETFNENAEQIEECD